MIRSPRSLLAFRRQHPRDWTFGWAMIMAGLSLVIGLGVTIYDGVLNDLERPRAFFIAAGMLGFYLPGLLLAGAAFGLRRGWRRLVLAGAVAAMAQGAMALIITVGHFKVTPFSPIWFVEGLLWTAADVYVAWRLWRALPWVSADAKGGFEVEVMEAEAVS